MIILKWIITKSKNEILEQLNTRAAITKNVEMAASCFCQLLQDQKFHRTLHLADDDDKPD